MAGGVALNSVGNGRIVREGPFERVWIQPAAGDAGGSLGAALCVWYQLLENERIPLESGDRQKGSLLGPSFSDEQIRACLEECGAVYRYVPTEESIVDEIASLIASGKVVGHMDGRLEFGPRALGNRSIIGDARLPTMQSVMNRKIKFRESFRPFAPAVLRDRVHDFFEMAPNEDSPYMLLVAPVKLDKRFPVNGNGSGLEKLRELRSVLPAITHVDYSARVQTVDSERHPRFHRILKRFEGRTECPVVINTSFNVRGEPIVCSPRDAFHCFMATHMDALVIGHFLLDKKDQREARAIDTESHLSRFPLD